MAFKKYGYYLKGNKIAVIEQSDATSSGNLAIAHCTVDPTNNTTKDTCEAAGGQWIPSSSGGTGTYSEYASPTESVAGGLEIQYAYSPIYHLGSGQGRIDYNKFYINGWTAVESNGIGYLALLRSREDDVVNWGTAPESSYITGLSAGDTGGQTKDYIVIRGSSRWNGLHEVSLAGPNYLLLKTKISDTVPFWSTDQIDFAVDETIFDGGGGDIYLADHFSANDYVWITGSGTGKNNGLFSVSSTTQSSTAASSKLTLGTRYSVVNSSDSDSSSTGLNAEYSAAASLTAETDQTDINIHKAFRDFCYIETNVDALNDENDTVDVTRYQANAVVYYLKAKLAEDGGDMEMREFFMREFKRQLEKGVSALKRGPYMVQGFKEMR
jgi:hypothetical protein